MINPRRRTDLFRGAVSAFMNAAAFSEDAYDQFINFTAVPYAITSAALCMMDADA